MKFPSRAESQPDSRSESKNDSKWTASLAEHHEALRVFVVGKMRGQGESAVDDVLQEVSIAAHQTPQNTIEPNRILSWLRQVASHKIQDHWRSIGRQRKIQTEFGENHLELVKPATSPSEWVMRLESRDSIATALKSLGPEDRAILEQKYLHGRTYDQIAQSLGLSLKTLEYRLSKAKQKIRGLLGQL